MKLLFAAMFLAAASLPAVSASARAEEGYGDEQQWAMDIDREISREELASAAASAETQGTDDPLLELAVRHGITAPDWLTERISVQGATTVLAALGDSITAGYATCSNPLYCPANSWAVGTLPTSVRSELSAASGRDVAYLLVAVPGAETAHMPAQAYAVFLASSFGLNVQRMTLFIGHNDPGVCKMPNGHETRDFEKDYSSTLKILSHVARTRRARLFVSSIVDVPALANYADVIPDGGRKACRELWAKTGRCAPLLGAGAPSDAGARISAHISELDAVLDRLAAGKDWVRYADIVNASSRLGLPDPARDLSASDCFHPSAVGQGLLGEMTWRGFGSTPGIASFFAWPKIEEPVARPSPVLSEGTQAELDAWRAESRRP
ncbi:MAG: GDSL-type esterase/lipase family protein [Elusimicrobiota bacterium]